MSGRKCVLFDLDGTLFDSSEGIRESYRKGLAHFGITVEDDRELFKVMGPSLYISYHEFFGLEGEQVNEAVRIYREHYNREGIYKVQIYDGIRDLLEALKQNNFTICVATSKPQIMAEKILDFSGIAPYFDVICGANLDGSRSDKVELINEVLARVNITYPETHSVEKHNVFMIGDRFYDIKGAISAGVRSIGVTYGFGSREELLEAGAEFIVDTAGEIAEILLCR